jgi:hypothetical protein
MGVLVPRIFLLILLAVGLAGCSALKYKPDVPISCDAISAAGIDYFKSLSKEHQAQSIADGALDLYSPGTLSRMSFDRVQNDTTLQLDEIFAYQRAGLPTIALDADEVDYSLFLIPPGTSAKALAQWGFDPDTPGKVVEYPAFIAVPEAVVRTGECKAGHSAFVIGAIENKSFTAPPQLLVSRESLEAMVNAFYLDKRSSDPAYLNRKIEEAKNPAFVNEAVWRGWAKLRVSKRSRWFWAKWIDGVDGELSKAMLGLPVDTPAGESSEVAIDRIDPLALSAELEFIAKGWFDKIGAYHKALGVVGQNIGKLEAEIRKGTLTAAAYQKAIQDHIAATNAARKELDGFQSLIEAQRPWFVTELEGGMYVNALEASLEELQVQFNKIAAAYADATRIANMDVLDPEIFLTGAPSVIAGELKEPFRKSFSKAERNLGASIKIDTVAFPRQDAAGKHIITVRGLINISDTLNRASGHLRRLIKSKDSCSKHVGSIRTNVGEDVRPNRFTRHLEADVESRTCWKVFGKRGWTRNFRATARGEVYAKIHHIGNGDVGFSYGWKAGVRVLVIRIGDGEEWSLGSVKKVIARDDLEKAKQFGLVIKEASFIRDKKKDGYLAVTIETKPLTADQAIVAYALLGSLL